MRQTRRLTTSALMVGLLLALGPTAAIAQQQRPSAAIAQQHRPSATGRDLRLLAPADRHDYLLQVDADYRQAMGRRRLGTGIAVAGGSTGFAMVATALSALIVSESFCDWGANWSDEGPHDCDHPGWISPLLYAGLAVTAVSVAVGLPVALSAHRRVKAIRRAYLPTPVIAVDRQAAAAALVWRF